MATDTIAPMPAQPIDVPWELHVPVADLYVVGYGNRLPNDLTLETLAILKRCKRLFGLPPINAAAFGIPAMESLAAADAPEDEILARVLDAAADGPVALATYGNPMVGTVAAHRLLDEGRRRGLTVHVANAVSALDGIWAQLSIDPFAGCQVRSASDLVQSDVVPDTRATLVLRAATANGGRLRDHLLRFYPARHIVHIATAGPGLDSVLTSVSLGELAAVTRVVGSTLVVPAR